MTESIFRSCFTSHFVPDIIKFVRFINLPGKVALFVNAMSTWAFSWRPLWCTLPGNTISPIQPCHQGLISAVKTLYTTSYMMKTANRSDDVSILNALKFQFERCYLYSGICLDGTIPRDAFKLLEKISCWFGSNSSLSGLNLSWSRQRGGLTVT